MFRMCGKVQSIPGLKVDFIESISLHPHRSDAVSGLHFIGIRSGHRPTAVDRLESSSSVILTGADRYNTISPPRKAHQDSPSPCPFYCLTTAGVGMCHGWSHGAMEPRAARARAPIKILEMYIPLLRVDNTPKLA